ncbi:eCIS core domain-containing protein [Amycolatopsis nigrescens]|uniref:eCIS core domain-containing protein n=1 Tax=Amycolatopsis nigrescens TaxID=381445 RepID=UPI00068858D2|nr:DUF4157 domain-containing protein [Amycolatopsis nigrescens]
MKTSAAPRQRRTSRKREADRAVARPPEFKDIVSGAGQPLDAGLRRELEERLGHDFSRVRIHAGADAAALTELLGAEAVALGQDVFFAEGAFHPETAAGRRLLAHELLHTVQVPHAPGPLRLGREPGVVSGSQDAVEQEAEAGVRDGRVPVRESGSRVASWLRYARGTAEQQRAEQLDPAAVVDRLVAGLLRSLRGDATDASGRVRLQLGRLAPALRELVLTRLEIRLSSAEYRRVRELVAEADAAAGGGPVDSAGTPEPVTDAADRTEADREAAEEEAGSEADQEERQEEDLPEESEKDEEEQPPEEEPEEKEEGEKESQEDKEGKEKKEDKDKKDEEEQKKEDEDKKGKDKKKGEKDKKDKKDKDKGEQAPKAAAEAAAQPAAQAPGAPGAAGPASQGPAAGATPVAETGRPEQQPGPARPERMEREAAEPEGPLARHGLLDDRDHDRDEEQEKPLGLEPGADAEVETPEPEQKEPEEEPPARPELKAEDYLPGSDLDVSNVPTADRNTLPGSGSPSVPQPPSFPAPPPTKAEQQEEAEQSEEPEEAVPEPEPAGPEAAAPAAPPPEPEPPVPPVEEPPAEQPPEAEVGPEPQGDRPPAPEPPLAKEPREEQEEPAAGPMAGPLGVREAPEPQESEAPGPLGGAGPVGADTGPAGAGAGPAAPAEPEAAPGAAEPVGAEPAGAPLAPEASLEPGGGACAGAPEPTTEGAKAEGGQGGCAAGGGGGAPAPAAEQEPPAPDVSGQPPEAALAAVGTLPPDRMQGSLSGVDSAIGRDVGEQQSALQAAPPATTRPSGAPRTMSGPPQAAPAADGEKVKLEKLEAQQAAARKKAEAEEVKGSDPAGKAQRPQVAGGTDGKLSEQEVRNVEQAVDQVPTTDPALHATVGKVERVELKGETDPARTDEQNAELGKASQQIHATGRVEAAKPLGEDQIYPNAPAETLTAEVPSGGGGGAGPAGGPGQVDKGVAVVAQQERGPQVQAGVAQGQAAMGTERQNQRQGEAQANVAHQAEVTQAVQQNAEAQAGERGKVAEGAAAQRAEWRAEQDQKVQESDTEAGKENEKAKTGITTEKTETDKKNDAQQKTDNDRIAREREQAEEKARKEKERKKEESDGGIFGWIASKVKSFFEGLLNAITAIFDAAVKLVNDIVKGFAKLVTAAIELARKAIVGLINTLANILIKLCDVLAVFFPELAAKIRKGIEALRDAAIAVVNKLADALKAGVEFLLNKLAQALTGLLRLLEAGLKAAVKAVQTVVNAAIEFAKAAIQLLGEFAAIIADIASMGVGAWLGRLGSSAKEGIQQHLWGAIKSAVKQWFNQKVESILGLGKAVLNVLVKGCMSMAKIGKMAWEALIASLPMIIIMVVVERLVSLIVPAAGAVLAVVQGLMAAWGTISKILAAIGAFIAFLKAVKAGPAACLFAAAVAAGVVALLEFITNFLMSKLAVAAKGVGRTLQDMAKKITAGLKRAGKGARKAAGTAVNSARRGLRSAAQTLRPPRRASRPAPDVTRRPGAPAATRPRGARPERLGRRRETPGRRPERRPERRREGEREAPPRRPGRVRAALNRVKGAVRTGLRRVGTALRKVGRKLTNGKLGRALRNGAKKLRDKYQRTRDRLRTRQRQRDEQRRRRDEQRKKKQEQTKDERLALIVARIRPKLKSLLRRGVFRPVLLGVLAGMRAWYRLTSLARVGGQRFDIIARLNPDQKAEDGAEGEDPHGNKVDRDVPVEGVPAKDEQDEEKLKEEKRKREPAEDEGEPTVVGKLPRKPGRDQDEPEPPTVAVSPKVPGPKPPDAPKSDAPKPDVGKPRPVGKESEPGRPAKPKEDVPAPRKPESPKKPESKTPAREDDPEATPTTPAAKGKVKDPDTEYRSYRELTENWEQRVGNYKRPTSAKEVKGAPPFEEGTAPGHGRSKHNVSNEETAKILNSPGRIFTGVSDRGRLVDIYWKDGSVVITEAGKKNSVITSYGLVDGRAKKPTAVSPEKWTSDPRYMEVSLERDAVVVIHATRDRWLQAGGT